MSETMNEETVKTEPVKSGPITFSPEQQEFFNRTLNSKYADWKKKETEKENAYEARIQELESKMDLSVSKAESGKPEDNKQLLDQLQEARRVIELGKAKEEAFLEKQKTLVADNERRYQELLNERKRNTLMNLSNKYKFMNAEHVVKLTNDQIRYHPESDSFRVYGESGEERYNDQLKHLSLDEFMTEFAIKNPHMVRGAQTTGTGATDATRLGTKVWKRSDIQALSPAKYQQYRDEISLAIKEKRVVDG